MIIWCLDFQNIKRVSLADSRIFILSPFQLWARLKTPTQAPNVANTCINSYLMAATIYSHLNHKYSSRNWVHFNQELIDFLPLSSLTKTTKRRYRLFLVQIYIEMLLHFEVLFGIELDFSVWLGSWVAFIHHVFFLNHWLMLEKHFTITRLFSCPRSSLVLHFNRPSDYCFL